MVDRGVIEPNATPVSGDTTQLAGSEWDYVGASAEDAEPAPGVREVGVVFQVTPEDQLASERLYSHCEFRAVDDQGRSWDAAWGTETEMGLETEDVSVADGTGCAAPSGYDPMPTGEATDLIAVFEVPEDVATDLRFEVEVATHDPEIDPDMSTEDALAELDEYAESADDEDHGNDPNREDNPPKPEAVSFPYRGPDE